MKSSAFKALLKSCSKNKDLYRGIELHDDILKRGLLSECSDALVTMYAKCGKLSKAKELLDIYKCRDATSWTALIAAYARNQQGHDALDCFEQMRCEGISPDAVTFVCILKACGSIKAADKGEEIHDEVARQGLLGDNIMLGNALVDMYAKCGALAKAQQVLEELPIRNVVSWNALITGYAQHCQGEQALNCFERMQREGLSPDAITFAGILKACASIGAVDKGGQIHDEIARKGLLGKDMVLGTALVDMYAKCGAILKAQQVHEELPDRNVFSWSALISGYAEEGQGEQALKCFESMKHEGISPNRVTFLCILKACGSIRSFEKGEQIHNEIARQGLLRNDIVLGNALIDMYTKCGALAKAQQVLEELSVRDVISWSSLIAGYAHQGHGEQALICFEQMQSEGLSPNPVTFACVLNACGNTGAIDKGEKLHDEIARQGLLESNILLGNALVDMYSKCGALEKAQRVLEELLFRDVDSWNALIAGYAQNGQGEQALSSFEQMQKEGLSPDKVTFLSILKACGSLGEIEKGEQIHNMIALQGLLGNDIMLCTALVDMYAKCGALMKAHKVLEDLPVRNMATYTALLGACEKLGDVKVGRWAFEHAMQVDKGDPAVYVLMSNIYAAAGMQKDAELIEAIRIENKAW